MPRTVKHYSRDPGDTKDVDVIVLQLDAAGWRALRRGIDDPEALTATFRAWQAQQETHRAEAVAKGYRVHDRAIVVAEALAWCRERKLPLHFKSISKYLLKTFVDARKNPG